MLSCFSHVQLFATLWTITYQAPLSLGFSRQEYLIRLPCPLPGDLLEPGTEPMSLMSPALADRLFTTNATWEVPIRYLSMCNFLHIDFVLFERYGFIYLLSTWIAECFHPDALFTSPFFLQ